MNGIITPSNTKMNKTELKCFNWLKKTYNLVDEDILYIGSVSPDFTLKDGRGFECKKVYGDIALVLRTKQWVELQETDSTVLLFNGGDEPLYKIKARELNPPNNWKHINITWIDNLNTIPCNINLTKEQDKIVRIYMVEHDFTSKAKAIIDIIKKFENEK